MPRSKSAFNTAFNAICKQAMQKAIAATFDVPANETDSMSSRKKAISKKAGEVFSEEMKKAAELIDTYINSAEVIPSAMVAPPTGGPVVGIGTIKPSS